MTDAGTTSFRASIAAGRGTSEPMPAFNILDLVSLSGVLDAAHMAGRAVITQFSATVVRYYSPELIVAAAGVERQRREYPFFVHLDHCRDDELIAATIGVGFDGVMVDGSHMSLDENASWTRQWADRAHDAGVLCEGELGPVRGEEDGIAGKEADASVNASVPEFLAFADATGVDLLGTDIGTAHGTYSSPPTVDMDFLADLAGADHATGFVVHGGSGLGRDVLRQLAELRIRKINFSTDLKIAWWNGLSRSMGGVQVQPFPALVAAHAEVRRMAVEKFDALVGGPPS